MSLIEFFKQEMKMLVVLAMKDPKCYQLWFHRKWILKRLFEIERQLGKDGAITRQFFEGDLQICDKFLAKDERNFHAWNYRSFLVRFLLENFEQDTLKILERELNFLRSKLETNFSNYSAIHFLTKYLVLKEQRLLQEKGQTVRLEDVRLPVNLLKSELQFLIQGLYIVPFEQSLWIY